MEALKMVPYIFLMLAITGVVAGAALITSSKFRDTVDATTTSAFGNTTLVAINKSIEGMGDVAEQFPTVGIIAVMVIIISLIAGVFVYMRFFR
jgi:hypothetical protein